MNVFAMPPPTISVSTFAASAFRIVSLVETFEPATIAISGRADARAPCRARRARRRAAGRRRRSARSARCRASWPRRGARCRRRRCSRRRRAAAILRASASSSFFSPLLKRQFSSSTTWPGFSVASQAPPSTQSRTSGTARPRSSARRAAIGASESAALNSPSFGRPRCEVTITAAPRASASRMPGSEARMRVSSVMRRRRPAAR